VWNRCGRVVFICKIGFAFAYANDTSGHTMAMEVIA